MDTTSSMRYFGCIVFGICVVCHQTHCIRMWSTATSHHIMHQIFRLCLNTLGNAPSSIGLLSFLSTNSWSICDLSPGYGTLYSFFHSDRHSDINQEPNLCHWGWPYSGGSMSVIYTTSTLGTTDLVPINSTHKHWKVHSGVTCICSGNQKVLCVACKYLLRLHLDFNPRSQFRIQQLDPICVLPPQSLPLLSHSPFSSSAVPCPNVFAGRNPLGLWSVRPLMGTCYLSSSLDYGRRSHMTLRLASRHFRMKWRVPCLWLYPPFQSFNSTHSKSFPNPSTVYINGAKCRPNIMIWTFRCWCDSIPIFQYVCTALLIHVHALKSPPSWIWTLDYYIWTLDDHNSFHCHITFSMEYNQ